MRIPKNLFNIGMELHLAKTHNIAVKSDISLSLVNKMQVRKTNKN